MTRFVRLSGFAIGVVGFLLIFYASGAYTKVARGAISVFAPSTCYTAAATTTRTALTAGTATTTITCPLGYEGARSASLLIQLTGSSTATAIDIQPLYSSDGIDYYDDALLGYPATTTTLIGSSASSKYRFNFASTTQGTATTVGGVMFRVVEIPVPTPYLRVVFTMPIGSQNGLLWAKIIPRQDVN